MGNVLIVTPGRQNGSRLDHRRSRELREGLEALLRPYQVGVIVTRTSPYACAETGAEARTVARLDEPVLEAELFGDSAPADEIAARRLLLGEGAPKKPTTKKPKKISPEREDALDLLRKAFFAQVVKHARSPRTLLFICPWQIVNLLLESFGIEARVTDQPLVGALLSVDSVAASLERLIEPPPPEQASA